MQCRRYAFLFVLLALVACGDGSGPGGAGARAYTAVSAGDGFTCALTADGRAWCWGQASFGQIGDGATTRRLAPAPVSGGLRFRSLSAGADHACGVAQDSTAWCWGLNDFSELGAATTFCNQGFRFVSCASAPIRVSGDLKFDSVTVGGYATCGLARVPPYAAGTQTAWCWGWNTRGEVGSGMAGTIVDEPTQVAGFRVLTTVSLDQFHACGVDGAGALFCWGSNVHGQLVADTLSTPRCGSGPATGLFCAPSPVASAVGVVATRVSSGSTHTCLLDAGGAAWCAGSNEFGVLGHGGAAGGPSLVAVEGGHQFSAIAAGDEHTCAISTAGATFCWGLNNDFQLAAASVETCPAFGVAKTCSRSPLAVDGLPALTRISAGFGHTCGVTADGQIWCWGRGTEGQLGNGQLASSVTPVRVPAPEPQGSP